MPGQSFEEVRSAAFAIAYRMLGSVVEAEDIAQEALLRMHVVAQSGERVDSPRAYVATLTTRLCIDHRRSARHRREHYVGEWLPEPVTGPVDDPSWHAEMADSLSLAFLVLLESLSPEQRAVFVLREVFDYTYEEIAEIIGKSEQNTRQLATRARRLVNQRRPRFETSRELLDELTRRFLAAAERGELAELEELLARDVVLRGDGGDKAPSPKRAIHGREKVARTVLAWVQSAVRLRGGLEFQVLDVNSRPGALARDPEGTLVGVISLDVVDGQIQTVSSIVNPDKLHHLGPLASWPTTEDTTR